MSVRRLGHDTSLKKLNSTASYDIITGEQDNQLDQSYGRMNELFPTKSPLTSVKKMWTNQNMNTLNSHKP